MTFMLLFLAQLADIKNCSITQLGLLS